MANAGQQVARCAYPGCENEPRPGSAEPGYCGLPDPVTGEPHTALTAFRQRQCRPGRAPAGGRAGGAGPPGVRVLAARWRAAPPSGLRLRSRRRARPRCRPMRSWPRRWPGGPPPNRRPRPRRHGPPRPSGTRRSGWPRRSRTGAARWAGAESRTRDAGQDAARARETAQSARAELDRARVAADLQARKIREDAARDQAELRAAFEAQIAAAEEARAALQARAEHAEAQAAQAHSATATRRPRRPPRHNPHARHDAAGALRKLSEEQLRAQNIPFGSGTGGHVGYQVADRIGGSRTPDPVNPGGGARNAGSKAGLPGLRIPCYSAQLSVSGECSWRSSGCRGDGRCPWWSAGVGGAWSAQVPMITRSVTAGAVAGRAGQAARSHAGIAR